MKQRLTRIWDALVLLLCVLIASLLMNSTLAYQNDQYILASKVWSDFGAHIPLIRSFYPGSNFPPEYPHFAGESITYHFLFYWFAAQLERLGLNPALALNLPSIIGFSLLLWFIFLISRKLFQSRLAGLIAVYLFLFNGSATIFYYIQEHNISLASLSQIASISKFVQFGPWNGDAISAFWNLNIYTNQRHLGLAFALTLGLLLPLFTPESNQKKPTYSKWTLNLSPYLIALLIPVSILAPLLHKAILPFVIIVAFWRGIFQPSKLFPIWLIYGLLFIFSLPATVYLSLADTYKPALHLGFLSHSTDIASIIKYWWLNSGLYIPFAILAFLWGNRQVKALLAGSLTLFAIANLVQLTPDTINNHKLINVSFLYISIGISGFIVWLWRYHIVTKLLVPILILILSASGWVDIFPIINDHIYYIDDNRRRESSQWILASTHPADVFLPADKFYNPASISGRKLWFGYSYFPWSLGYDTGKREELSRQMFSSNINQSTLCQLLINNHIDYIIISRGRGEIGDTDVQQSTIRKQFAPAFNSETEGQTIYSVVDNCLDSLSLIN